MAGSGIPRYFYTYTRILNTHSLKRLKCKYDSVIPYCLTTRYLQRYSSSPEPGINL